MLSRYFERTLEDTDEQKGSKAKIIGLCAAHAITSIFSKAFTLRLRFIDEYRIPYPLRPLTIETQDSESWKGLQRTKYKKR